MSIFDLFKSIESETKNEKIEWIVAGLGNPGQKYAKTRHNTGFTALDYIATEKKFTIDRVRFRSLTGECSIGGRVLFVKPQTFMNLSGEAIAAAINWYKLPPEKLIVIYDDISLAPGRLRIRAKGSDGGHNGIKDIIKNLGTDSFPRIKIGVGSPSHPQHEMIDWVLGTFNDEDQCAVTDAIKRAASAVEVIINSGTEAAASKFNATTYIPEQK